MNFTFNKESLWTMSKKYFRTANQCLKTPETLNQAYNVASIIKSIEDEHFNVNEISTDINERSNNVTSYLQNVHGFSDITKASVIILFTNTFVDFYSLHVWEDILEEVASHLGLPANRNLIGSIPVWKKARKSAHLMSEFTTIKVIR